MYMYNRIMKQPFMWLNSDLIMEAVIFVYLNNVKSILVENTQTD